MTSLIPNPIPDPIRLRKLNARHQLIIDSEKALRQVSQLDPMYWSVNSAPMVGLSCNQQFLQYLDSDKNQRIMPFEIILACQWMIDTLSSLQGCIQGKSQLSLANFREDSPQGKQLKQIANLVLHNLGKKDQDFIQLSEVQARTTILAIGATNGDGILAPSVLNGVEKEFVENFLKVFDGEKDINGELGLNEALLNSFIGKTNAWFSWQESCPYKQLQSQMLTIMQKIQPQLDQHFTDAQLPPITPREAPLTQQTHNILSLNCWVHPKYRDSWKNLWIKVLHPLDIKELDWKTWEQLWGEFQEYDSWLSSKPTGNFQNLPTETIKEMCLQTEIITSLLEKLHQDKAVSQQLTQLADLEKTLLFQQNLCTFLNSFVNFSDFYNPNKRSMPEIGSLLLDGRWFRLVVQVPDLEQHKKQASNSGFFLLYLSVSLSSDKKMNIAVAVTGSERGDLHIGKKGVFYDTQNNQCPAEIIHIIDNPINIKEAFLQPFEKLQKIVKLRFERFSQEQEKKIETGLTKEPKAPIDKNLLMGGGVTVAALSSSFAYLVKTLTSIQFSSILLVILAPLGILALVSSLIAGWRLHRRDLGPILESSGWGINHPLPAPDWAASIFTLQAIVPKSQQDNRADLLKEYQRKVDPYGNHKRILLWLLYILLALLIYWNWDYIGLLIQEWEHKVSKK